MKNLRVVSLLLAVFLFTALAAKAENRYYEYGGPGPQSTQKEKKVVQQPLASYSYYEELFADELKPAAPAAKDDFGMRNQYGVHMWTEEPPASPNPNAMAKELRSPVDPDWEAAQNKIALDMAQKDPQANNPNAMAAKKDTPDKKNGWEKKMAIVAPYAQKISNQYRLKSNALPQGTLSVSSPTVNPNGIQTFSTDVLFQRAQGQKAAAQKANMAPWAKALDETVLAGKDKKANKPNEKSKGLDKLQEQDPQSVQSVLALEKQIKAALAKHLLLKEYYVEVLDICSVKPEGLKQLESFLSLPLDSKEGPISHQERVDAINKDKNLDEVFQKPFFDVYNNPKKMVIFFNADSDLTATIDPIHKKIILLKKNQAPVCFEDRKMTNGKVKVLQKYFIFGK